MQYEASGVAYADNATKSITSVLDIVENVRTEDYLTLRESSASSSVAEGRVVKHRDTIINQHALCPTRRRIFSEISPNLPEQNAQVRSINSHLNNQISLLQSSIHKHRLSSNYDENLTPSELLNQFGGNRNKERFDEAPTSVTGSVNGLNGYLKMNQGPTRRVRSVTSPPHPIPLGRQANRIAMDGASYQRFPRVKIRVVKDDYLKFELRETDASMANGLQRMMISEVPTLDVTTNKDVHSSDHSVVSVDFSDSAAYDSSEHKGIITVEFRKGQELMLSVGKDHENWSPAATVTFMYERNIYINEDTIETLTTKVFGIDENSQQSQANRRAMEGASYQRFPHLKITELKDDFLKFELGETDASMANGFQRMMISEVSPLDVTSKNDMYSSDHSVVPVDFSDSAGYESSEQKGIITVELRKGRELMLLLSAIARKGVGKDHENWSPAATVTFMYEPEICINEDMMEILTYEEKKALVDSSPTEVLDIDENSQQKEGTKKAHTNSQNMLTVITDLPSDVLSKIFCHLSIRDVGKSFCVCKPWCRMTKYMQDYSGDTSLVVRYCGHDPQKEYFCQYNYLTSYYPVNERKVHFPSYIMSPICMIGISNGLICFRSGKDIVLWNPCLLKLFAIDTKMESSSCITRFGGFGFGYDKNGNDFKVVKILYEERDYGNGFKFSVFSLKSNKWNDHPFLCFGTVMTISWKQSVLGGLIHWLIISSEIAKILTFDLRSNAFGTLCLPEVLSRCPLNSLSVKSVNGTLAIAYFQVGGIQIWHMLANGWTRVHNLVPRIENSLNHITDVLWMGDRRLLIEISGRHICPYSIQTVFCDLCDMRNMPIQGTPYAETFTESFALYCSPTSYSFAK